MNRRNTLLAVVFIAALTAVVVALNVDVEATQGSAALEPKVPHEAPPPAPAAVPTLPAMTPEPAAPAVSVWTGPTPPVMPTEPRARANQLLQLRAQRRTDAMNQLNSREAARRARLGLPPK